MMTLGLATPETNYVTSVRHYSQRMNFVNYLRQLSGIILLCPLHGLQMVALSSPLHTSSAKIYTILHTYNQVLYF